MKEVDRLRCCICYESYPRKRLICCSSGHRSCGKCIRKIARNSAFLSPLKNLVKGFPCSEYRCTRYIKYEKCTKFLPKRTRQHIQTKMWEALLKFADISFEKCQKCDFLAEVPREMTMKIFKCPQCSYTFCCDCGKKCDCNHSKKDCFKIPTFLNEKYTNALIHRCYKCSLPFIKDTRIFEGCNLMTCKCGAKQCYACRKPNCNNSCSKISYEAEKIHQMDIAAAAVQKPTPSKIHYI